MKKSMNSATREGDTLHTTDEIRPGDVVVFERIDSKTVHLRLLHPLQIADFVGEKYKVGRGTESGTVGFESIEDVWNRLRYRAQMANGRGSNWERYAIPIEAIAFLI